MPPADAPKTQELLDTWGRRNRRLPDKLCQHCGTLFKPKRTSSRYCSQPCAWANNGGHNIMAETWWLNSRGYLEGSVLVNGEKRRVKQHRWVVEQAIGRPLTAHEDIHHRNGIKTDNSLENLEIIKHGIHSTLTNNSRLYQTGYQMNLSDEERIARSERMRLMRRAAIAKATGDNS